MQDELRPRAMPTPAAGNAYGANLPDLPKDGAPPMPQGTVFMSDMARKNLELVGWKDGDPIPGDLGSQLQLIRDDMLREAAAASLQGSELAAGWTPPKVSFVKISDLTPAKQEEVRQLLQDYKQQVELEQANVARMADIESSIPPTIQGEVRDELIRQAQQAVVERNLRGQGLGTVIDDRVAAAKPADQPAAAPQPSPAPPQPAPAVIGTELPSTGAIVQHTHCQRCQWPTDRPFTIEPSTLDKEHFIAAVLGQSLFKKRYTCMDGKMAVTCRSLSVADVQMIQQQLGAMVRSAEVVGDSEYIPTMHQFRLALTVSRIVVGGNVLYVMPGIDEWVAANPPTADDKLAATPLPRLVEYFYKHATPTESIRRIIGNICNDFQRLVEMLEVMADRPDFW